MCKQLTYEHRQTHGQANAKSHTHVVDFKLPAGQIVLLRQRLQMGLIVLQTFLMATKHALFGAKVI